MEKIFFMKPVLDMISQGKFLMKLFVITLRIITIIIGFISFIGWVFAWMAVFKLDDFGIIGGILFQLFYIVAVYIVIHTIILRTRNITGLPESEYTVIPIVSICLRMIGEIYAGFTTVIAAAGGVFTWFSGYTPFKVQAFKQITPLIPGFGDGTFYGGLQFIVGGILVAFLVLVVSYFLSELIVALLDNSRNLRVIRQIAEQYNKMK